MTVLWGLWLVWMTVLWGLWLVWMTVLWAHLYLQLSKVSVRLHDGDVMKGCVREVVVKMGGLRDAG
jgi:hypothetical protein